MDDRSLYTPTPAAPAETKTEQLLVRLWQEVLEVSPVGREDNFFELGGTSMLAVRIAARVEAEIGQRPPLDLIFEAEMLADAAAAIDELLDKESRDRGRLD